MSGPVTAKELKAILVRYKKAMRPRIGDVHQVSAGDLKLNLALLGARPHRESGDNRTALRRQVSRRMTQLRFNNVLCLRKGELVALYNQLLGYARRIGGPPTDEADPRYLPVIDDGDMDTSAALVEM